MEGSESLRSFADPGLIMIFPVYGVADVVAFVLDSPVIADVPVDVGGGHLLLAPASKDEGVFFADAVAGYFEGLAAYAGNLLDVREVDTAGTCAPAGPLFYPATVVFFHDVVRGFGQQRVNFRRYRFTQGWLISLEGYQVVPPLFSSDDLRGVFLCVRRICGYQDNCAFRNFRRVQKCFHLGDLVGAVGDPDLRYRYSLVVQQCGKHCDLAVFIGPCIPDLEPVPSRAELSQQGLGYVGRVAGYLRVGLCPG